MKLHTSKLFPPYFLLSLQSITINVRLSRIHGRFPHPQEDAIIFTTRNVQRIQPRTHTHTQISIYSFTPSWQRANPSSRTKQASIWSANTCPAHAPSGISLLAGKFIWRHRRAAAAAAPTQLGTAEQTTMGRKARAADRGHSVHVIKARVAYIYALCTYTVYRSDELTLAIKPGTRFAPANIICTHEAACIKDGMDVRRDFFNFMQANVYSRSCFAVSAHIHLPDCRFSSARE